MVAVNTCPKRILGKTPFRPRSRELPVNGVARANRAKTTQSGSFKRISLGIAPLLRTELLIGLGQPTRAAARQLLRSGFCRAACFPPYTWVKSWASSLGLSVLAGVESPPARRPADQPHKVPPFRLAHGDQFPSPHVARHAIRQAGSPRGGDSSAEDSRFPRASVSERVSRSARGLSGPGVPAALRRVCGGRPSVRAGSRDPPGR